MDTDTVNICSMKTFVVSLFLLVLSVTSALAAGPVLDNLRQLQPSSRRSALIISEIMYHPADRADSNDLEFIEIFNTEPFDKDISGFQLAGDIDFTFPQNTVIPQRSFIVVAKEPTALENEYGLAGVFGPLTRTDFLIPRP